MSEKTDNVENISNTKKILTSLTAGGIAGGIAKTAIAPLDRSKIFFQTNETRNYRFRYALRWLRHGYRTEGFLSLWRGNTATLARIVPYSALNFMSFEQYKKLLKVDHPDTPSPSMYRYLVMVADSGLLTFLVNSRFAAGSLAGSTGQMLTYPLDRARAVMAVTNSKDQTGKQYKNLVSVFANIYRTEGLLAFYRGLTPTLLGVIPYAGTSFFTYETLKGWTIQRRRREGETGGSHMFMLPTPVERLGCGAIAGLLGQASSYPLDIVRLEELVDFLINAPMTSRHCQHFWCKRF